MEQLCSRFPRRILASRSSGTEVVSTKRRSGENREDSGAVSKKSFKRVAESSESCRQLGAQKKGPASVRALHQNGDPLGKRDLGKGVVQWICQGMRVMALDFAIAEMQGGFSELKQRMGPGLTLISNWRETESWKQLKELANSAQHRAIKRKTIRSKSVRGVLGLDLEKVKAIQNKIDEFTNHLSNLLRVEFRKDAELEFSQFTQEELNAILYFFS
ncbi:unnamed protein product [Fraxinus pennsylvanica]|uniref:Uncharacterized protein n=1 Tax=Fraxinus pennsylvanica TaxID=56036 RepID=A0AAD1ZEM5_9LAMI|nr:unnamed protein product [Fraxinus pennsylvanica]